MENKLGIKTPWLPKYGDAVLVRNIVEGVWFERTFVGINPSSESAYKYITVNKDGCSATWKEMKPIHTFKTYLQELVGATYDLKTMLDNLEESEILEEIENYKNL